MGEGISGEGLTRRTVLKAGAVGVASSGWATLLAACSTSSNGGTTSAASTHLTPQQYWAKYGQIPQGTFSLGEDVHELDWWKPHASKRWHLGATIPDIVDPHFVAVAYGIARAATELGVTIDFRPAASYADVQGQLTTMNDFISKKVDGIVIGPVSNVGMSPPIQRAWNAGIFVTYVALTANDQRPPFSGVDLVGSGVQIGKFYAQQRPNDKVAVLGGPGGVLGWKQATDGEMQGLKTSPGIKILGVYNHDLDITVITDLARSILTAHPDVQGFVSFADIQAQGVIAALRTAGYKPGAVQTTGNPLSRQDLGLMQEGWFTMAQRVRSSQWGRYAVWLLVHMLEGNQVPDNLYNVTDMVTPATLAQFENQLEGYDFAPAGWTPPATMK